MKNVNKFHLF